MRLIINAFLTDSNSAGQGGVLAEQLGCLVKQLSQVKGG